jgi:hypothetical protein
MGDESSFGSSGSDRKNWREIIKGMNLEGQLSAAGAPPWVSDFLKKAATLSADAASSAGEKLGKTLNTVQFPLNLSKEILRETLESLLENYTLEVQAKIDFKKKEPK